MTDTQKPAGAFIAENAFGLSALQLFVKALSAVWTFYLARRLGVERYGLWANVMALVFIFGAMHGFGVLSVVIKEVIQKRELAREYYGASLLIYMSTALFSFLMVLFIAWHLGYPREKLLLSGMAGLSLLCMAPGLASQSILYGHERFIFYTVIYCLGTLVYMLSGAAAVEAGWGVMGVFAALSLGYAVSSAVLISGTVKRHGAPTLKDVKAHLPFLINLGWPLVVSGALSELMLRADRILIDRFHGEAAVGAFHAAFNLVYMPREIVLVPFLTALYTRLCGTYASERSRFDALFEKANLILLFFALPVAGFCTVFSRPLIQAFYGAGYEAAAGILTVLVWMLVPLFPLILWQNMLIMLDRTRTILWINLGGTAFSLLFNYLLLPRWGVVAAAWAAGLTQLLMLFAAFWCTRRELPFSFLGKLPRLALAFLAGTLLLRFLSFYLGVNLFWLAAAGVLSLVVYGTLFFLSGLIRREEAVRFWRQIRSSTASFARG